MVSIRRYGVVSHQLSTSRELFSRLRSLISTSALIGPLTSSPPLSPISLLSLHISLLSSSSLKKISNNSNVRPPSPTLYIHPSKKPIRKKHGNATSSENNIPRPPRPNRLLHSRLSKMVRDQPRNETRILRFLRHPIYNATLSHLRLAKDKPPPTRKSLFLPPPPLPFNSATYNISTQ